MAWPLQVEEGAHFVVDLRASVAVGGSEEGGGESGESGGGDDWDGGAFVEPTARGLLIVVHESGMDASIAFKVALGLQEYLIEEGM